MSEVRIDLGSAFLVFDTEDIEDSHVSVKNDTVEVPSEDGRWKNHKLTGYHHLYLNIDFKHGKKARFEAKKQKEHPE